MPSYSIFFLLLFISKIIALQFEKNYFSIFPLVFLTIFYLKFSRQIRNPHLTTFSQFSSINNIFFFTLNYWKSRKKERKIFTTHIHSGWKLPWLLSTEPRPTTNFCRLRRLLCLLLQCMCIPFRPYQHNRKFIFLNFTSECSRQWRVLRVARLCIQCCSVSAKLSLSCIRNNNSKEPEWVWRRKRESFSGREKFSFPLHPPIRHKEGKVIPLDMLMNFPFRTLPLFLFFYFYIFTFAELYKPFLTFI